MDSSIKIRPYLQSYDQGVFAGEKYVHVGDELVVGDEKQPEDKEGGILENDCYQDAPHVHRAANLLYALAFCGIRLPFGWVLACSNYESELHKTPRPYGQNHETQDFVRVHLFILYQFQV